MYTCEMFRKTHSAYHKKTIILIQLARICWECNFVLEGKILELLESPRIFHKFHKSKFPALSQCEIGWRKARKVLICRAGPHLDPSCFNISFPLELRQYKNNHDSRDTLDNCDIWDYCVLYRYLKHMYA